jgi:chemotaxis protein methyltransferase CheR
MDPEPWSEEDFRSIEALLKGRRGLDLSPHRLRLIQARLQHRLRGGGAPSFRWFYDHVLHGQPLGAGMQLLIDLSTVNHTSFFRESLTLGMLADDVAIRMRATPMGLVRVWSAGCSAGQEPYSFAMYVAERTPGVAPERLELWASDVSLEMVQTAARAIYHERLLGDVPADRLRRFFLRGRESQHGQYRIAPEIRRLVRFVHFDLRSPDWPMPIELDAILCRNVAIYFEDAERTALLERLARRLRRGGWLAVGNCEIFPEVPGLLEKHGPSLFRRVPLP